MNKLLDELHAVRRTWHVNEGKCPCCQDKANIKDIIDRTSEETTTTREVSHSLVGPDVKQETDTIIGEAEKGLFLHLLRENFTALDFCYELLK